MQRLNFLIVLTFILTLCIVPVTAQDYKGLAKELQSGSDKAQRIAVLKFKFAEEPGHPLEKTTQEELTYLLVKTGKFSVLERSLIDKVLEEQQLTQSGLIDQTTAKKIGQGSGAEAIVTGTITRIDREKVKIQARMIKTDTYDIIAIGQITADAPRAMTEEEKVTEFAPLLELQIYGGYSHADMSLAFENKVQGVKSNYLTFLPLEKTWSNVEFEKLSTKDTYPLGIRFIATSGYFLGGVDISYFAHAMDKQMTNGKFDGIEKSVSDFLVDEYITSSVTKFSIPLGVSTYAKGWFRLYMGVEPGFALVNTHSDLIYSYEYDTKNSKYIFSKGLDTFSMGFYIGGFLGLNIKLTNHLGIFSEARVFTLSYSFNRNINGESDTVTLKGYQAVAGVSFRLN